MALIYDGAIQEVIDSFAKLPGIGPKGAQRIAFYLLSAPKEEGRHLADAITTLQEKVRFCEICGNVTEESPCRICSDPRRDHSTICVVERPSDILPLDRTGQYHGLYHVLGGVIDPMGGVTPDKLRIKGLIGRLKDGTVKEVILALNPTIEGDATMTYITRLLDGSGIKVTKLASGLSVGSEIEYADEITLGRAFAGRRPLDDAA